MKKQKDVFRLVLVALICILLLVINKAINFYNI